MICYLYHICHEGDVGDLNKGYVGIAVNVQRRWNSHKRKTNPHLGNAINLHKDKIKWNIISQGTTDEMLVMEKWLRPEKEMGWNIEKGGGLPPNLKGHKWSEETKKKRRQSLLKANAEGRVDRTKLTEVIREKHRKSAIINKPDGTTIEVNDYKLFAEQEGLNHRSLMSVLKGNRASVYGYSGQFI